MKNKKNYRFLKNDEKYPNFFKRLFSPVKYYIRDYYVWINMKTVFVVSVNNKHTCFGVDTKSNIFDKSFKILKDGHGLDIDIRELTLNHSDKNWIKYKIFTDSELLFYQIFKWFYRNYTKVKFIEYNYDRYAYGNHVGYSRYTTQFCMIVDDKIIRSNVNLAGYYACQELYDKLNIEFGIPYRGSDYRDQFSNAYFFRSSNLEIFN